MSDLPDKLREHFRSHHLDESTIEAMVQGGRRRHRVRRVGIWAGGVAILLIGIFLGQRWLRVPQTSTIQVEAAVSAFFSQEVYTLATLSDRPEVLARWIRQHALSAPMSLPERLGHEKTVGCVILRAGQVDIPVMCFALATPVARPETPDLLHVATVRVRSLADAPPEGEWRRRTEGAWEFAVQRRGEQVLIFSRLKAGPSLETLLTIQPLSPTGSALATLVSLQPRRL